MVFSTTKKYVPFFLRSFVRSFNVRSQREIHLGVSSFRVFFLFVFFEARERESDDTYSLFLSPFGRALFRNGLWGKEGLQREEVVVGSLFVILRVVVGREREQEEGLL